LFVFQVIAFLLEMGIWIFIAGILIFNPWLFFENHNNMYDNKFKYFRRSKFDNVVIRVPGIVIGILITIYITKPYLYDLPKLITGSFSYATGYVTEIYHVGKVPSEYVVINGKEVEFFFSANVKEFYEYEIAYLPNTSRAFYGVELDHTSLEITKKIVFPLADILFFILIMAVFVALVVFGIFFSFLRFKLLIVTSFIYYTTNIYVYITQGLNLGNWFSISNKGILFTLVGIGMLLFLCIIYLIERCKEYETPFAFAVIQIFSIFMVLILFGELHTL